MNKNRIWLFAGLGILTTCISILAAKKFNKKSSGAEDMWPKTRYRQRVE